MVQARQRWLPLILGVLAAAALTVLARHHHGSHPVKTGETLPALSLVALDGRDVQLGPKHGTVVYNVFTTWCPSCRAETPSLARAAAALRKHGIEMIGIDQGEQASAVSAFVDEFRVGYPVVVDPNRQTNALLGARVIPETIVVRDGVVRAMAVGPLDGDALQKLVAQSNEEPHA